MIAVCRDPFSPDREQHRYSGPFIEWLQVHYPEGFPAPVVVVRNGRRLRPADFDAGVWDGDLVCVVFAPATVVATAVNAAVVAAGGWGSVLGTAAVSAAVGVAINYAIGWIFGTPTAPSTAADLPQASPVYSLSVPSNQARLGQPVPVIYGSPLAVPDIAAQPYVWYEDNEQYLGMIMCLGQGEHQVDSFLLADTPVDQMPTGTISTWVFQPDDHGQVFGTIQDATGVFENIDTSPEVSDQELADPDAEQANGTIQGDGVTIACVPEVPGTAEAGSIVIIAWDLETYIQSTVVSVAPDRLTCVIADDLSGLPTTVGCRFYSTTPKVIGSYAACAPGQVTSRIGMDIVFPEGLYGVNEITGTLTAQSVDVQFVASEIDDSGDPLGPQTIWTETVTAATRTPQRLTFWRDLSPARYNVSAERKTLQSRLASARSVCVWTNLKAHVQYTGSVYGETTMLAVKMKATNGVSRDAQNRIGVRCTRKLEGTATANPADAFADIFTNTVYGGGRPLTELDTDELADRKLAWAEHNGFNAVFDSRETVWSAMQRSIQVVNAYPAIDGGVVTIVQDALQTTAAYAFDESRMIEGSLAVQYRFDTPDDVDGYEVEHRDPVSFLPKFSLYPATSVKPERVVLFGCTCPDTNASFARLLWQKRTYRRKSITFQTELIGLLPVVNDRINVTHRILGDGETAQRFIVTSVQPGDGYQVTIEAMYDDPRVFDGVGMALSGVSDV